MHQHNGNQPKNVSAPVGNAVGSLYPALLAAGWVFVVGMAVFGTWAVGTQVESGVAVVCQRPQVVQELKRNLGAALMKVLWAASASQQGEQEVPEHWQLRWERLSLAQQRELVQRLGLSASPNRFRISWSGEAKRPRLVVRMVLSSPGEAPARLQHLLHRASDQAVASYRHKLSRELAAVRNQAREHWQALIQIDSRLRQWLQEVLGPQAAVTPVAYWRRIPGKPGTEPAAPVLSPASVDPADPEKSRTEEPAEEGVPWAQLTIQQLRRRVAQLEAQDQELAARLTEQHPQRQQLQETLRRLRVYLARRLKQAGQELNRAPASSAPEQLPDEDPAQQQLARLLQQHAHTLRQFQEELDRLSRAYLETAQREARLWTHYQQLERARPLQVGAPRFTPVWLVSRRNFLALLLALAGAGVAVTIAGWHRWSLDTFTSAEQMGRELNQPVVAVAPWWYEAGSPPRKRWRQRLQRLQRLLEWSLLGVAAGWGALALLHAGFRQQWVQDPLLAVACWWRYLAGG